MVDVRILVAVMVIGAVTGLTVTDVVECLMAEDAHMVDDPPADASITPDDAISSGEQPQ